MIGPYHSGFRIRIRPATDRYQRDRARMNMLDCGLCEASPIAADFVVRKRYTVAGITDIDRANCVVICRPNNQHRQIVVNRSAVRTTIFGETYSAFCPGQFCWSTAFQCGKRNLFECVSEFFRISVDVSLVLEWNWRAEDRVANAVEFGCRVCVSERD